MTEDWHEDPEIREELGDSAEDEFIETFKCHCGKGQFQFIGTEVLPDFTCDYCGQLVDVKTSPKTEKWGNVTISQIPFDNYPDDLIIAVRRSNGVWCMAYKQGLIVDGPHPPTHSSRPTWFYKVALDQFVSPEELGIGRQ